MVLRPNVSAFNTEEKINVERERLQSERARLEAEVSRLQEIERGENAPAARAARSQRRALSGRFRRIHNTLIALRDQEKAVRRAERTGRTPSEEAQAAREGKQRSQARGRARESRAAEKNPRIIVQSEGKKFRGRVVEVNGKKLVLAVRQGETKGRDPKPKEQPLAEGKKEVSEKLKTSGGLTNEIIENVATTRKETPIAPPEARELTSSEAATGGKVSLEPSPFVPTIRKESRGEISFQEAGQAFKNVGLESATPEERGLSLLAGVTLTGRGIFEGAADLAGQFNPVTQNPVQLAVAAGGVFASIPLILADPKGAYEQVKRDPLSTIGQVLLTAGVFKGVSVLRTSPAASAARGTTGQPLTVKTAGVLEKSTREVSTQIKVAELEKVIVKGEQLETSGVRVSATASNPVFGGERFLTSKDLANLPDDFVFSVKGEKTSSTSPGASRFEGLTETSKKTTTVEGSGLLTGEQLSQGTTPKIEVAIAESSKPPSSRVFTEGTAEVQFQGIELSKSTEIAPLPGKGGKSRAPTPERLGDTGGKVEFKPSLDFFESLLVDTPEQTLLAQRSFATGAETVKIVGKEQTGITPLIIKEVTTKPKKSSTASTVSGGIAGGGTTTVDLGGGLVGLQKTEAAPKSAPTISTIQEEKSIQEKKIKQEPKAPKVDTVTDSASKTSSPSTVTVKSPRDRVTILEKSKAKSGLRTSQRSKIAPVTIIQQQSASAQAQSTSLSPAQDTGQIADIAIATDIATDTSTVTGLDSSLKTSTLQSPLSDFRTPSQPRRPPPKTTPRTPPTPFLPKIPRADPPKERRESFTVFGRRRGVFSPLETFQSLAGAASAGATFAKQTAGASFKVIGSNRGLVDVLGLSDRRTFRRSKREVGVVVQKRSKRITSIGEKTEIRPKGRLLGKARNIFR